MEIKPSDSQISKRRLSWADVYARIEVIKRKFAGKKLYGIPRGGQIIAGLTGMAVDTWEKADYLIDDIVDSGRTEKTWKEITGLDVIPFVHKDVEKIEGWVEFPWEENEIKKDKEDCVVRILEFIGENPKREGIVETPERVTRSWNELFSGYNDDPKRHIKLFDKSNYDQMVVLTDCEFYSTCEHHLIPFFGKLHIGYIPNKKVIGLSKLARIAECFTRRLQLQERIGEQITDFLMKELDALGAGCVIKGKHLCMSARGANKQNSEMVTSSLKGKFRQAEVRAEFLKLING